MRNYKYKKTDGRFLIKIAGLISVSLLATQGFAENPTVHASWTPPGGISSMSRAWDINSSGTQAMTTWFRGNTVQSNLTNASEPLIPIKGVDGQITGSGYYGGDEPCVKVYSRNKGFYCFREGSWKNIGDPSKLISILRSPKSEHEILFYREATTTDKMVRQSYARISGFKSKKIDGIPGYIYGGVLSTSQPVAYVLSSNSTTYSSLLKLNLESGTIQILAQNLEAYRGSKRLGLSPDGNHLFLAILGKKTKDDQMRHIPIADRFFEIFQFNLKTKTFTKIISSDAENFNPFVYQDRLYWTRTALDSQIRFYDLKNKRLLEPTIPNASHSHWHPSGKKISYNFGSWRFADWALNIDIHESKWNHKTQTLGSQKSLVSGFHEDYGPVYSPDGKWLAYHSHRSITAVPDYSGFGSSDDVYLKRVDQNESKEIRLTHFGIEVGVPSWNPKDHRLLFVTESQDHSGSQVWTIKFDQESGSTQELKRLKIPKNIKAPSKAIWISESDFIIHNELEKRKFELWRFNEANPEKAVLVYKGINGNWANDHFDSKRNTYWTSTQVGQRMHLVRIDLKTGNSETLDVAPGFNQFNPSVSPDGRVVSFSAEKVTKELLSLPLTSILDRK
ncbi:MAG: PD40 domain-containing protein [Pseudobacteriovorax sp.]|nr:PD40 domain-containing protein [Pseudobacteriovorax sp.]